MRADGWHARTRAVSVPVDPRLTECLPGCSFADAFCAGFVVPPTDARHATHAIFDAPPGWVNALMAVRNCAVRLFWLKPAVRRPRSVHGSQIGVFPVLAESPHQVLLGFDDRHLDFRVAVAVEHAPASGSLVTVTTLVRTNNRLGRAYLGAILPFHRLVVRGMLQRAASRRRG